MATLPLKLKSFPGTSHHLGLPADQASEGGSLEAQSEEAFGSADPTQGPIL